MKFFKKFFLSAVFLFGASFFLSSNVQAASPVITSFTVIATSTSLTIPVSTFTATDDVGVTGYLLSESSTTPAVGDPSWSATAPDSFTFSGANNVSPNVWAGNIFNATTTWKVIGSSADGNTLAQAATDDYLYLSSDGGATWTAITDLSTHKWSAITISDDGSNLSATAIDYVNTSVNFDNSQNIKLFTSLDGGMNWYEATGITQGISESFYMSRIGRPTVYPNILQVSPSANGRKLAAIDSNGRAYYHNNTACFNMSCGLSVSPNWLSSDYISESDWSGLSLTSSADNLNVAAVTSDNRIFTSSDGGASWTERLGSENHYWSSVIFSSENTKFSLPFEDYFMSGYGNNLYAWVKDADGNITGTSKRVLVDTRSSFLINSFSIPSSSTTTDISILSFKSANTNEIIGYKISESSTTPSLSDAGWQSSLPVSYTFANHGYNTLYAWVKDELIGVSNIASSTTLVDTKPFINSFTLKATSSSLTVPIISLEATDDIAVVGYKLTETSTPPTATSTGWFSSAPTSYTFQSVNNNPPSRYQKLSSISWNSITSSADGVRLAATKLNSDYIYTSVNSGGSWSAKTSSGSRSWGKIVSSADGLKIAAINGSSIYVSLDGGNTWTERAGASSSFADIAYSSDGSTLVKIYTSGYIYTSEDDGLSWTERSSSGDHNWSSVALSTDGSVIAATSNDAYVYLSLDSGETWNQKLVIGGAVLGDITSSANGLKLAVVDGTANEVYASSDGGETWRTLFSYRSGGIDHLKHIASSVDGSMLTVTSAIDFYWNGFQTLIFVFSDDGEVLPTPLSGSEDFYWKSDIAVSANGKHIFVVGSGIYNFNYGNTLYAWTKDSTGNVSEEQFYSLATIDLTPVNLNLSSSLVNMNLDSDMKYVPTIINLDRNVNRSTLNLSTISTTTATSTKITIPQDFTFSKTGDFGQVRVDIASGTVITANNPAWSAIFTLPETRTPSNSVVGDMKSVLSAYEIGDPNNHLTLTKAAKITFYNSAGKRIGFSNSDDIFHEILDECSDNTQMVNDLLADDTECKITVGDDLIIWTKHFSEYIVYEDVVVTSSSSYVTPTCTSVVYSDWQSCASGFNIQFRNVVSQIPANCSLTVEQRQAMERICVLSNFSTDDVSTTEKTTTANNNFLVNEKSLLQKINKLLSKKLAGRILLQVEEKGEAWYVNPLTALKHYLGRPADAFNLMRTLGLGISNDNLNKFQKSGVPVKYAGRIFLQVEDKGQAYYVNPLTLKLHYLGSPSDAFSLMKKLGLGISNSNIRSIDLAE